MSENNHEITPTKKPRFFWGHIGILFSGAAAVILIVVVILASHALLTINNQFAASLNNLTNRFEEAQKNAVNSDQSLQQINDALKTQSQQIADIQKTERTNKNDFIIMEAFYLVKMANDYLQYENNVPVAIKLLQSADQDMAKITDPKIYPVRQAMASDLAALQAVPDVDVAGIYARLSALNEQINKLSLKTVLLNTQLEKVPTTNNESLPWWRRGLNSMELALQRIVIVRRSVPNAPPFIAPDQQVFLYQNLQSELEKAQWSLLHRQAAIYQSSLVQALNWIKQYAVADSSITKQLQQNLMQLQQINIHPATPNLTGSLQALQKYMSSENQ